MKTPTFSHQETELDSFNKTWLHMHLNLNVSAALPVSHRWRITTSAIHNSSWCGSRMDFNRPPRNCHNYVIDDRILWNPMIFWSFGYFHVNCFVSINASINAVSTIQNDQQDSLFTAAPDRMEMRPALANRKVQSDLPSRIASLKNLCKNRVSHGVPTWQSCVARDPCLLRQIPAALPPGQVKLGDN